MKKKELAAILSVALLALPVLAQAAGLDSFISSLQTWINRLIPIVFAVCLLVFLWGLVIFISKSGDETARGEGKQRMLWGIIALFVAASIWGIVRYIGTTLNIGTDSALPAPWP